MHFGGAAFCCALGACSSDHGDSGRTIPTHTQRQRNVAALGASWLQLPLQLQLGCRSSFASRASEVTEHCSTFSCFRDAASATRELTHAVACLRQGSPTPTARRRRWEQRGLRRIPEVPDSTLDHSGHQGLPTPRP